MKKTLVAIAALAATGAFAQSSVMIDGLLDVSYANISTDISDAKKGATIGAINGSATSVIRFTAIDDIGGGLKGNVKIELDPRPFVADGGAIGRHQAYVGVSGGFGEVKLGTPDSLTLGVYGMSSPLGTATGSGYAATNATLGMSTRYNRTAHYLTPNFSGLQAAVGYTPGNDGTAAAYAGLPFQRSVTEVAVTYANGPLNAGIVSLNAGSATSISATAPTSIATSKSTSYTTLGANYNMGAFTAYVGANSGKTIGTIASTSGPVEFAAQADGFATKGNRLGLKYVTGAYTAIASIANQKVETAIGSDTFTKRKVTGMRLENALSKRTTVYVAYEAYDNGTTAPAKTNITAIGVRSAF